MSVRKPNFFIIGAPKCGTTTLAAWLSLHYQVYFSSPKEPGYFCSDVSGKKFNSVAEYEALFLNVQPYHAAVGEGSTWALASQNAVLRIAEYQPDARFIVMLRSPIDLCVSLHAELLFQLEEDVEDFSRAWALQAERREGLMIPPSCSAPRQLQYGEMCLLGAQLERLFSRVPRERVSVIFLEDLSLSPEEVWERLNNFLGLQQVTMPPLPIANQRKALRAPSLKLWLRAVRVALNRLGINLPRGVMDVVHSLNTKRVAVPQVPESMLEELRAYFYEDIAKVSALTGRDLTSWLERPSKGGR